MHLPMRNRFLQPVSFLLVQCLIADPTFAIALSQQQFVRQNISGHCIVRNSERLNEEVLSLAYLSSGLPRILAQGHPLTKTFYGLLLLGSISLHAQSPDDVHVTLKVISEPNFFQIWARELAAVSGFVFGWFLIPVWNQNGRSITNRYPWIYAGIGAILLSPFYLTGPLSHTLTVWALVGLAMAVVIRDIASFFQGLKPPEDLSQRLAYPETGGKAVANIDTLINHGEAGILSHITSDLPQDAKQAVYVVPTGTNLSPSIIEQALTLASNKGIGITFVQLEARAGSSGYTAFARVAYEANYFPQRVGLNSILSLDPNLSGRVIASNVVDVNHIAESEQDRYAAKAILGAGLLRGVNALTLFDLAYRHSSALAFLKELVRDFGLIGNTRALNPLKTLRENVEEARRASNLKGDQSHREALAPLSLELDDAIKKLQNNVRPIILNSVGNPLEWALYIRTNLGFLSLLFGFFTSVIAGSSSLWITLSAAALTGNILWPWLSPLLSTSGNRISRSSAPSITLTEFAKSA